ncbi:hypothetical protein EYC84_008276 [Monilinia fructicola]|uniref:Uncharacterized protein n=1 Tax=Monilinia fructicola TaxID=38448 RepID=A0A5M9JET6_MONFR|nr:hypothetical protein EYC84_008276 [Monilinia fructicola]
MLQARQPVTQSSALAGNAENDSRKVMCEMMAKVGYRSTSWMAMLVSIRPATSRKGAWVWAGGDHAVRSPNPEARQQKKAVAKDAAAAAFEAAKRVG